MSGRGWPSQTKGERRESLGGAGVAAPPERRREWVGIIHRESGGVFPCVGQCSRGCTVGIGPGAGPGSTFTGGSSGVALK